jgi:endonuclease-3 related protein
VDGAGGRALSGGSAGARTAIIATETTPADNAGDGEDGTAALPRVFDLLEAAYGAEVWHWMPDVVRGPMDVIAGAVLVQHTTWANAERALDALRAAGVLDAETLATMPEAEIAALVRVSGTPSVKTRRLVALARTVERAGGVGRFAALPREPMRAMLLATHGVGPETADAIALYVAGQRVFMIDAYTMRVFRRLGLGPAGDGYDAWQRYFEDKLRDGDASMFQRYHGCIVLHGKALCRVRPRCAACPLLACCPHGRAAAGERR